MSSLPWREGVVIRIKEEAPLTRRYWIKVTDTDSFDFKPGQFVTLDLPIDERPAKRQRSYSIASWPDGTNVFELVIVLLEGGAGTTYIFNHIAEGSVFTFRGALGVFTMPEHLDKDLFLICTGTGVAPFRSMMHYIEMHNIPHQDIYLIFGCREKCNILYYDELRELSQRVPLFHYIPTLSRQEWEGKSGYVHAIYEDIAQQKQPAYFFLCGWKNMIDEAKQRIIAMGYDRKSIHQELYG